MLVRHRNECVEIQRGLVEFVRDKVGKDVLENAIDIERIRSDNDTVFSAEGWDDTLRKLYVTTPHSVPYCPQQNGVIERFMQTLGTGLRTNLVGVDKRLYCYCGEYLGWIWNRTGGRDYFR